MFGYGYYINFIFTLQKNFWKIKYVETFLN